MKDPMQREAEKLERHLLALDKAHLTEEEFESQRDYIMQKLGPIRAALHRSTQHRTTSDVSTLPYANNFVEKRMSEVRAEARARANEASKKPLVKEYAARAMAAIRAGVQRAKQAQ
jgi:hypothetical protein